MHFRPTSSEYGSLPTAPMHKYPTFEKAKMAASVRYLQAPYLGGAMAEGSGLDARPAIFLEVEYGDEAHARRDAQTLTASGTQWRAEACVVP